MISLNFARGIRLPVLVIYTVDLFPSLHLCLPQVNLTKNEDIVAFGRKNEMLVQLVGKLDLYKKAFGNYAGYWLKKLQISRNALTHMMND